MREKHQRGCIVRLEIPLHPGGNPKTCTQWTQIDVPTEIVRLLQERNRLHFGQIQGAPFTMQPLVDLLGIPVATSRTQQQLIRGTFDVSEFDNCVQLLVLLGHLQYTHAMSQYMVRPTISDDDFIDKLLLWSESTTTSPSGMHLGLCKALIARHSYSSDA